MRVWIIVWKCLSCRGTHSRKWVPMRKPQNKRIKPIIYWCERKGENQIKEPTTAIGISANGLDCNGISLVSGGKNNTVFYGMLIYLALYVFVWLCFVAFFLLSFDMFFDFYCNGFWLQFTWRLNWVARRREMEHLFLFGCFFYWHSSRSGSSNSTWWLEMIVWAQAKRARTKKGKSQWTIYGHLHTK